MIRLTYLIETEGSPEKLAAKIAADQSTGTFVALPGETEELKARVAARVVAVRPLPPAKNPSFPSDHPGPFHRAEADIDFPFDAIGTDLAALMNVPSRFVWTHDSVALGEDGPTHQPIEQLATLRAIPNLAIVRPADANEVSVAWMEMLRRRGGPIGIALTRQNIPVFERGSATAEGETLASAAHAARGAYVLAEATSQVPAVIVIATGSEVQLALQARQLLEAEGIGTRVVSAPCLEWFDEQDEDYREAVLPRSVKARVSVEAGLALGWQRFVGECGESVSIEHFGASADYATLFEQFGVTAEAVAHAARTSLQKVAGCCS